MNTLVFGLAIIILAALFQGSFAVPMAYARSWKWENSWMVFSVFGMIVLNLLFALLSVPGLFSVYGEATAGDLFMPLVFGIIWGVGAIGFGLGVTSAGISLGYPILLGTVLSMGMFIPMVVLHPAEILTRKGILVLFGLAVTLLGIITSGYAGIRKEREQGQKAGEITKIGRFSVRVGILICFIAGVCSSAINVGFSLSRSLVDIALSHGASENWAGNVIWGVLFTSGGILNILYCAYLLGVNRTTNYYRAGGSLRNFILLLLMSLMWIGSFILYGVGATMMGGWGIVIGWAVYMVLSIAVANVWGIAQGEWKGVSRGTKMIMARALVMLFVAILIFAYSGTV
jgi:L-rhamnose-H+ transport protein